MPSSFLYKSLRTSKSEQATLPQLTKARAIRHMSPLSPWTRTLTPRQYLSGRQRGGCQTCRAGHGGGTAGAGGPAWAEQSKDGHQHGRSWPGGARGTGPEGGGAALQGPSAVLLHSGQPAWHVCQTPGNPSETGASAGQHDQGQVRGVLEGWGGDSWRARDGDQSKARGGQARVTERESRSGGGQLNGPS